MPVLGAEESTPGRRSATTNETFSMQVHRGASTFGRPVELDSKNFLSSFLMYFPSLWHHMLVLASVSAAEELVEYANSFKIVASISQALYHSKYLIDTGFRMLKHTNTWLGVCLVFLLLSGSTQARRCPGHSVAARAENCVFSVVG